MLRIPLVWFLAPVMLKSFIMDFRIAFLCEFSKGEAQIRRRYGTSLIDWMLVLLR